MASAKCPYCKSVYILPDDFHDRVQCASCTKMFVVETKDGRARTVIPANYVLEPPANLDKRLASDLQEACACFNVGAYKATVVMARRFLEAILDQAGFKGKTLFERVHAAHDSGVVSDLTYHLASSMRILGNYGAHYSDDQLAQIGPDEAEFVLNMVRQVLKSLVK